MYALNLSEDNRILSACVVLPSGYDEEENPIYEIVDNKYHGMPIVRTLPDGNVSNYLFVDGEYVYDPLPSLNEINDKPSEFDILEAQVTYTAMMTDTLLEV